MSENPNDFMRPGHVVRVHPGGRVTDAPDKIEAPEGAYVYTEGAEPELGVAGWELMRGYTLQSGYNGAVMHDSEGLHRRLQDDIRERPGLYAVLPVDYVGCGSTECDTCGAESGDWCADDCEGERETLTEGWVVAYREYPAWRFTPDELAAMPDRSMPDRGGSVLKVERDDLRVYLNSRLGEVFYDVRIGGDDWFRAEDDRADVNTDRSASLRVSLDPEWTGGSDWTPKVTLYHFTDAADEIVRSQEWDEPVEGAIFFSDRRDGHATGYGSGCVSVTIPVADVWLNDEFPDGEKHYAVPPGFLAGVPITRVEV